jgi:hypothetical protein
MMGSETEECGELSAEDFRFLFVVICRAMAFDALRMKPREKQLALLLASESFGEGSAWGAIDIKAWRLRMPVWRSNELKAMFENWRRAGWLAVDVTEKTFRLAPDQFPGWANVQAIQRSEERQAPLSLMTEDDLHKTFAKISQIAARDAAKISQRVTKISQPGEPTEGNVRTFIRSDVERINVSNVGAITKISHGEPPRPEEPGRSPGPGRAWRPDDSAVRALKGRVRDFVGESDWTAKEFWNLGMGWRHTLFAEEYEAMEGALAYCQAALKDRDSGITVKRTKGAMLWNEFQRLRKEKLKENQTP